MTEATARFALPYILPGQAQKELFHNEALAIADFVLHPVVEGAALSAPPSDAQPGEAWLVAPPGEGPWSGRAHSLACWTGAGWRFAGPVPGMLVWNKAAGFWLHWTGSGWSGGELPASRIVIGGRQVVGERQRDVPSPSGGTTIDVEARAAIDQLIVALKSHGLID